MAIEDLMNALQRAIDAQHQHNKAHDEYQGGSWDYAGHYVIEDMKKAQADFENALRIHIDERIEVALAKKGTTP